jgi:hypothetical protein
MTGALDLAARNDLHASLPCGDPGRLRRPRTSRPFACWTGCHTPAGRVEGRSRPWRLAPAFGRPLDPPGRFLARRHRSPGAGEEPSPTSRQHQEEDAIRQFEQDWLELGSRVARSLHYQHPRNLRLLDQEGGSPPS